LDLILYGIGYRTKNLFGQDTSANIVHFFFMRMVDTANSVGNVSGNDLEMIRNRHSVHSSVKKSPAAKQSYLICSLERPFGTSYLVPRRTNLEGINPVLGTDPWGQALLSAPYVVR
jgi:hypothetical protein